MSTSTPTNPPFWDPLTIVLTIVALSALGFVAHCAYEEPPIDAASIGGVPVAGAELSSGDDVERTRFVVRDSSVQRVPIGIPWDSTHGFGRPVYARKGVVVVGTFAAPESGRKIAGIRYDPLLKIAREKGQPAAITGSAYKAYLYSQSANEAETITLLTKHGVMPGPASAVAKEIVASAKSSLFRRSTVAVTALGAGYVAIDFARPKWSLMCKAAAAIVAASSALLLFVALQRRGILA